MACLPRAAKRPISALGSPGADRLEATCHRHGGGGALRVRRRAPKDQRLARACSSRSSRNAISLAAPPNLVRSVARSQNQVARRRSRRGWWSSRFQRRHRQPAAVRGIRRRRFVHGSAVTWWSPWGCGKGRSRSAHVRRWREVVSRRDWLQMGDVDPGPVQAVLVSGVDQPRTRLLAKQRGNKALPVYSLGRGFGNIRRRAQAGRLGDPNGPVTRRCRAGLMTKSTSLGLASYSTVSTSQ